MTAAKAIGTPKPPGRDLRRRHALGGATDRSAMAPALGTVRLALQAMGTRFEFALVGEDESHLQAVGEEALGEIAYLHGKLSYFRGSSIVTCINRHAAVRPVDVDRETFALLALCRDAWEQSDGAFDITIAPVMHRLGFRADGPPSGNQDVIDAKIAVGMQHVLLDPAARTVRLTRPGVAIDLGAVAKGYALDRAGAICREHGITCGLLHGGTSTVLAIGAPPSDNRGWGVRIHDEHEPLTVRLRDSALSVSAPRGRTVNSGRGALGHVIDPRTCEPTGGATTAAVIADDAALADAWSTALLVAKSLPETAAGARKSMIRLDTGGWHIAPPTTVANT